MTMFFGASSIISMHSSRPVTWMPAPVILDSDLGRLRRGVREHWRDCRWRHHDEPGTGRRNLVGFGEGHRDGGNRVQPDHIAAIHDCRLYLGQLDDNRGIEKSAQLLR